GGARTAMSTIKPATTVPAGQTQYIGAVEANGGAPLELPVKPLLPELAVGARHGLTERGEGGAKLTNAPAGGGAAKLTPRPAGRRTTTAGLEGEVKVQLRRVPWSRIELALGPAAGFRWVSAAGAAMQVTYATVPFLMGIDVGRHQIVVAPEVGLQL